MQEDIILYMLNYNCNITSMIRRINHSKSIKQDNKRQKSQQSKALKGVKNQRVSPVYKQLIINKENIHPNQHQPSTSTQQRLDCNAFRQKYYDLKSLKQSKKASRVQNPSQPSQPKAVPCIHITTKSLQKCQIHPLPNPSSLTPHPHPCLSPKPHLSLSPNPYPYRHPSPHFLITQPLLCCQQCASSPIFKEKNKIPLQKFSNISYNGITIAQYFQVLDDRFQQMVCAKRNIQVYETQFRNMATNQLKKCRKYYHQILEIIQESMKDAQSVITRLVTNGQAIFVQKRKQIELELQFTEQQINRLNRFKQKHVKYSLSPLNSNIELNPQRTFRRYSFQLSLPAMAIHTQIPQLLQNFKKLFCEDYSLKILTQKELSIPSQQQQKASQLVNLKTSNSNRLQNTAVPIALPVATSIQNVEPDLFCDQQLCQNKTDNTHNFSFDASRDQETDSFLGKNINMRCENNCILELVQEEDVISPVFKAI